VRPTVTSGERAGEAGLEALLESVADDAAREAASARADAQRAAEQRLAEAEQSAQRMESGAEAAGAVEGAREARRRIALAEIETRKALLARREAHLERALEQAAARLRGRLEADPPLVAAWIRAAAGALGERAPRVWIAKEMRARVEPLLAGELEPVYEELPEGGPGVVVASADGRREVEATLRGIVARRGEGARARAAAALFGDEEADS